MQKLRSKSTEDAIIHLTGYVDGSGMKYCALFLIDIEGVFDNR